MSYYYVTPTDVDRFIQLPDTLDVDARSIVLTVEEDTMFKYDKYFLITDWVIYCETSKANFLNTANMDWQYRLDYTFDASGVYQGPQVYDAHSDPAVGEIAQDVIDLTAAKAELGTNTTATRFAHYKQCNRFFKYSFKIGDAVTKSDRDAQLFGVYIDSVTGKALKYWKTTAGNGSDQSTEQKVFFYANIQAALDAVNNGTPLQSTLDGSAADVTVACPPDPEFLETDASGNTVGGSLAYATDASGNLAVRPVGQKDASGNPMIVYDAATNFVEYTEDTDYSRVLVLYWIVNPPSTSLYLGEEMYAAWSSSAIGNTANAAALCPIRDFTDPSGNATDALQPTLASDVKQVDKFVLHRQVSTTALLVEDGIADKNNGAVRMFLPTSRFVVNHISPTENDVPQPTEDFNVPFAFEVANQTDFEGEARKSIMGGRVMQLVSQYLFDAASNKEMGYFPFLMNESKQLTDKILEALAAKIKAPYAEVGASRTFMLKQIMIKHGKRYFEEYGVLTEAGDGSTTKFGSVWNVLSALNEIFLFFSVSVKTTVSNRTKDDVEVIRLVDVPVVVRIHD